VLAYREQHIHLFPGKLFFVFPAEVRHFAQMELSANGTDSIKCKGTIWADTTSLFRSKCYGCHPLEWVVGGCEAFARPIGRWIVGLLVCWSIVTPTMSFINFMTGEGEEAAEATPRWTGLKP